MNAPLVTVVVPIYNVEKQLRRCVDSILNQTYRNLEIILVDDGSPDNCPQICDEYAKLDSRVKVIHKVNAGLGMARNTGIDNATGEYIYFCDSDDYIDVDTIKECCELAEKENADLVCFGHSEEMADGKVIFNRIPTTPKDVFDKEEVRERLIPMTLAHNPATGEDWNLSLSAWCELFSMRVIKTHNWRFVSEREIISEDVYSVLEYYGYAEKVAFIKKPFYHYITNPHSLTQSYREDRYENLKVLAGELDSLSVQMGMQDVLRQRVYSIFLGLTIGALKQIVSSPLGFKRKYIEIKKIVYDDYMQSVLSDFNYSGEGVPKKALFGSIRYKLVLFSFAIIKFKCNSCCR